MKILMVSLDFPPTLGGIAAHVYELSNALSAGGHRVAVLTRRYDGMEPEEALGSGVRVFRFKLRLAAPLYGWQIDRYVKEKLPELKPDIIHLHGMAPLEGFRVKGIPIAYTNHTSGYLKRIEKGGIRRMALIRRLFKKPSLFIAPSRELLSVPFDIDAKKVFIPNGVDGSKYRFSQEDRDRYRASLGFDDTDIVAILTRRLVEKNGVIYLARGMRFIRNKHLKLLIIGDGEERAKIERELSRWFEGRYAMLGALSHDDIIPYYSAADVSVLPSLMEATSISGLEAMATGLPLVGTRVGGIPDLIEEGSNGYLCRAADSDDIADKIDLLLSSDMKAMGRRSRQMIEGRFLWCRIAEQTLEAYGSIQ